jgi:hypothetical protein
MLPPKNHPEIDEVNDGKNSKQTIEKSKLINKTTRIAPFIST